MSLTSIFDNALGNVVASILISALMCGASWYGLIKRFLKRNSRFEVNLRRKIIVIGETTSDASHIVDVLRRAELFNVDGPKQDSRATDLVADATVVVYCYSNPHHFEEVFAKVKAKSMPLIIFAKHEQLSSEQTNLIRSHTDHIICNSPLRLVSDVFGLISTYPEVKK